MVTFAKCASIYWWVWAASVLVFAVLAGLGVAVDAVRSAFVFTALYAVCDLTYRAISHWKKKG